MCISCRKTTPSIPNLTQDNQYPSFVPETVEAQKIHGLEDVPGKKAYDAPINDDEPVTEDPKVNPSLSFYYEFGGRGVENMRQ